MHQFFHPYRPPHAARLTSISIKLDLNEEEEESERVLGEGAGSEKRVGAWVVKRQRKEKPIFILLSYAITYNESFPIDVFGQLPLFLYLGITVSWCHGRHGMACHGNTVFGGTLFSRMLSRVTVNGLDDSNDGLGQHFLRFFFPFLLFYSFFPLPQLSKLIYTRPEINFN